MVPVVDQSSQPSKRPRAMDVLQDTIKSPEQGRLKRRRFSRDNDQSSQPVVFDAAGEPADNSHATLRAEAAGSYGDKLSLAQSQWSLEQPLGGHFSNLDPVFTADEKYVFLGVGSAVHVFSMSTSRLFRIMRMKSSQKVIGYKLSPENQEHLYISTSSGSVSKWDWVSGKQISLWETSRKTISAEICFIELENMVRSVSYFLREQKDGRREISISPLEEELPSGKPYEVTALETTKRIRDLKVSRRGQVVIVCDGQRLFVGNTSICDVRSLGSIHYTWREVVLPVNVTCLDLRESLPTDSTTERSKARTAPTSADLVLGESGGSILVYHDIVNSLTRNEDMYEGEGKSGSVLRRLHWHRGPVSVVRWSRDGNYLISGGLESVMVLWQLDSGRKQFLPHLSSPICNIVVSPSGNLYALKLADNSVIVLSATELQPSATITGLQLPSKVDNIGDLSEPIASSPRVYDSVPAVLHPQNPDHLMVVVPASQTIRHEKQALANLSVLQTFDVRTGCHLARQALARTNLTVLNTGPDGAEIVTPDIKYFDLSQDGKWLATVDNWHPHPQDVKAFTASHVGDEGNIGDRREVFLKFWIWNELTNLWELVTRVDGPHFRSPVGPVPVLGLVSRPGSHEFATIGADGILRFWGPTTRHRSGIKSRSHADRLPETWKCRNALDLKGNLGGDAVTSGSICFSEDGSVLAVCLHAQPGSNFGVVHLIDVHKCEVRHSRSGLFCSEPFAAKFLGRHLIIALRESISIWDIVDDTLKSVLAPDSGLINSSSEGGPVLLAVNPKTQTFAITARRFARNSDQSSRRRRKTHFHVEVYDLHSSMPIFRSKLGHCPLTLLSDPRSGDYVVVDAAANVQRLSCCEKAQEVVVPSSDLSSHLKAGLENLFGDRLLGVSQDLSPLQKPAIFGSERTSLQSKQLAGIFGTVPSFSLPPVSTLFRDVVNSLVAN
ncbi:hypothetical protein VTN00DRAFT_7473 [Thermoascus crustaceus]|uniref:uncharacterized protein n=1 Tax=Thermoascus crustaceus TaxID=5088 RepID=UPI003743F6CA